MLRERSCRGRRFASARISSTSCGVCRRRQVSLSHGWCVVGSTHSSGGTLRRRTRTTAGLSTLSFDVCGDGSSPHGRPTRVYPTWRSSTLSDPARITGQLLLVWGGFLWRWSSTRSPIASGSSWPAARSDPWPCPRPPPEKRNGASPDSYRDPPPSRGPGTRTLATLPLKHGGTIMIKHCSHETLRRVIDLSRNAVAAHGGPAHGSHAGVPSS